MPLLRRSLNPALATARPVSAEDHGAIARMLTTCRRRFLAVPSEDLPELVAAGAGAAMAAGTSLWAAAVGERSTPEVAWLRALALADGLPFDAGLDALLSAYHAGLRAAGVLRSLYTGSDASDAWLRIALAVRGYTHVTDVVVYEKIRMDSPAGGHPSAHVRPARPADLSVVLALDHACFGAEWHKDQRAIVPALAGAPCFRVAELDGRAVGYTFATSHYGGRLIHLVRIAVLPAYQGKGIGARLLSEVVAYARGADADVLTLNTQADNLPARRLYERFGFRRTGERQAVLARDL